MFLVGFCGLGMVQFMMMFMLLGMGTDIYIASAMYLFMTIGGSVTSKFCLKRLYSTGLKPFLFMGPLITFFRRTISDPILYGRAKRA